MEVQSGWRRYPQLASPFLPTASHFQKRRVRQCPTRQNSSSVKSDCASKLRSVFSSLDARSTIVSPSGIFSIKESKNARSRDVSSSGHFGYFILAIRDEWCRFPSFAGLRRFIDYGKTLAKEYAQTLKSQL